MKLKKTKETNKQDLTELVDLITEDEPKSEVHEVSKKEIKELEKETKKEEKKFPLFEKIKKEKEKKEKEKVVSDKTTELEKVKPVEEKDKTMKKRGKKKFKLDLSVIIFIVIILLFGFVIFYLTIGQRGNKYGDRLRGIEKISFTKKDKSKYVDALKGNERVKSASMDVQGRLIYVIVDFKEDVSLEDARNIINESLANLSDEVKGYYDINALITKSDEKPNEAGDVVFPDSGYKRKTSDHIVW